MNLKTDLDRGVFNEFCGGVLLQHSMGYLYTRLTLLYPTIFEMIGSILSSFDFHKKLLLIVKDQEAKVFKFSKGENLLPPDQEAATKSIEEESSRKINIDASLAQGTMKIRDL